ncbi:MAG: class I SAM-dependent methyltransferase [Candidatus Magasanikbacteria bacterium]|nr:class I SAM-dependent methyltransferase [Candidatus Magasanikbacteria bacterium]
MQNARQRAIDLYSGSAWESFLSKFKFWEEPYEAVDAMLPRHGTIVELGCAEGLLSNYLAISSSNRSVIGYEIVPERLARAKKRIKNTRYFVGDIIEVPYPKADAVVLFHVLHHLPGKANQELVLRKAKQSLKKGGTLVIVEVHVKPTVKYIAAWIADHFLVPWVFEKRWYTRAYFRTEHEWTGLLKRLGFTVNVTEETSGRPFPNIMFECKLK